jgi:hypothetical protein
MSVFTSVSPVRTRLGIDIVLVTFAIILIGSSPSLEASQPAAGSRVLVMPFAVEVDAKASRTESAALWLGEAAAVLLTDGLASRGVGVIDRDERLDVFDRLQLPMSATLTRATLIRVADIFGASEIVFGEVGRRRPSAARRHWRRRFAPLVRAVHAGDRWAGEECGAQPAGIGRDVWRSLGRGLRELHERAGGHRAGGAAAFPGDRAQ